MPQPGDASTLALTTTFYYHFQPLVKLIKYLSPTFTSLNSPKVSSGEPMLCGARVAAAPRGVEGGEGQVSCTLTRLYITNIKLF